MDLDKKSLTGEVLHELGLKLDQSDPIFDVIATQLDLWQKISTEVDRNEQVAERNTHNINELKKIVTESVSLSNSTLRRLDALEQTTGEVINSKFEETTKKAIAGVEKSSIVILSKFQDLEERIILAGQTATHSFENEIKKTEAITENLNMINDTIVTITSEYNTIQKRLDYERLALAGGVGAIVTALLFVIGIFAWNFKSDNNIPKDLMYSFDGKKYIKVIAERDTKKGDPVFYLLQ